MRATTEEFREALRRALSAHFVPDLEAPAYLSVELPEEGGRVGAARFFLLHQGTSMVTRTRDPRRLVHALLQFLGSFGTPAEPALTPLAATVLVHDGSAMLAPANIRLSLAAMERRLNMKQVRIADVPVALLDSAAGEVVVPDHGLTVDVGAVDDLVDSVPGSRRDDPIVEPGRYPVRRWAFLSGAEERHTLPRAQAVLWAANALADLGDFDAQRHLDQLAATFLRIEPVGLEHLPAKELATALATLTR